MRTVKVNSPVARNKVVGVKAVAEEDQIMLSTYMWKFVADAGSEFCPLGPCMARKAVKANRARRRRREKSVHSEGEFWPPKSDLTLLLRPFPATMGESLRILNDRKKPGAVGRVYNGSVGWPGRLRAAMRSGMRAEASKSGDDPLFLFYGKGRTGLLARPRRP